LTKVIPAREKEGWSLPNPEAGEVHMDGKKKPQTENPTPKASGGICSVKEEKRLETEPKSAGRKSHPEGKKIDKTRPAITLLRANVP